MASIAIISPDRTRAHGFTLPGVTIAETEAAMARAPKPLPLADTSVTDWFRRFDRIHMIIGNRWCAVPGHDLRSDPLA